MLNQITSLQTFEFMDDSFMEKSFHLEELELAPGESVIGKLLNLLEDPLLPNKMNIQQVVFELLEKERRWAQLKKYIFDWRRIKWISDFVGKIRAQIGDPVKDRIPLNQLAGEFDRVIEIYDARLRETARAQEEKKAEEIVQEISEKDESSQKSLLGRINKDIQQNRKSAAHIRQSTQKQNQLNADTVSNGLDGQTNHENINHHGQIQSQTHNAPAQTFLVQNPSDTQRRLQEVPKIASVKPNIQELIKINVNALDSSYSEEDEDEHPILDCLGGLQEFMNNRQIEEQNRLLWKQKNQAKQRQRKEHQRHKKQEKIDQLIYRTSKKLKIDQSRASREKEVQRIKRESEKQEAELSSKKSTKEIEDAEKIALAIALASKQKEDEHLPATTQVYAAVVGLDKTQIYKDSHEMLLRYNKSKSIGVASEKKLIEKEKTFDELVWEGMDSYFKNDEIPRILNSHLYQKDLSPLQIFRKLNMQFRILNDQRTKPKQKRQVLNSDEEHNREEEHNKWENAEESSYLDQHLRYQDQSEVYNFFPQKHGYDWKELERRQKQRIAKRAAVIEAFKEEYSIVSDLTQGNLTFLNREDVSDKFKLKEHRRDERGSREQSQ